jgi:murein hydrolase activator
MNPRTYCTPGRTRWVRFLLLAVCFFGCITAGFAQTKKELEKKKEALHKEIEYTNKLLNQTSRNKSSSISQLVTLNKKINVRTELISTIHHEIGGLDSEIGTIRTHIDSLEKKMTHLKEQYALLLYYAYKSQGTYSRLLFILSAGDFNQAYKRFRYLRHLSEYRISQQQLILQFQDSLNGKISALRGTRVQKSQLLTSQKKEKGKLDQEKKQQVQIINNLSQREKKLRADLKQKQRDEEKLNREIEKIIRKEIEAAQKRAQAKEKAVTGKSTTTRNNTSSSVLAATPEAIKLSNDFSGNKGKLPWPVEQGFISSTFGRHAHPVWKDVVVNNNGIDINSNSGARARAIFNGTVLRVLLVVDKYAVLVQHGEYFTLYSNLRDVTVKSGDKVITKQTLGIIQTDEDDGKTEVHLEIWKGSNKMDPQGWIAAKN